MKSIFLCECQDYSVFCGVGESCPVWPFKETVVMTAWCTSRLSPDQYSSEHLTAPFLVISSILPERCGTFCICRIRKPLVWNALAFSETNQPIQSSQLFNPHTNSLFSQHALFKDQAEIRYSIRRSIIIKVARDNTSLILSFASRQIIQFSLW